ncbi:MAG: Uma2 family endonuclease [Methylohalobius sp.]|nr:Uma2 family endonuclease [Methylohalobius sp.]
MATPAFERKLTPEEYLELERASPVKHEYRAGHFLAMTGTSDVHNLIVGNLYMLLRERLRGSPCRVFIADVKVWIKAAEAFYYPDLMVSCEPVISRYYREHPCLIAEVLSPSTAKADTQDKWRDYQKLEGLAEYVLIAQECMDVRVYRRSQSGWDLAIYTDGTLIELTSVGLKIPIERIYQEVWD